MAISPIYIGLGVLAALVLTYVVIRISTPKAAEGPIGVTHPTNPASTSGSNLITTGEKMPDTPTVSYEKDTVKPPPLLVSTITIAKNMSNESDADMKMLQIAEIEVITDKGEKLGRGAFSSVEYGPGTVGTSSGQAFYPAGNVVDGNMATFTYGVGPGMLSVNTLVLKLVSPVRISSISVYNRSVFSGRLSGTTVYLSDASGTNLWESSKLIGQTGVQILNPKYADGFAFR